MITAFWIAVALWALLEVVLFVAGMNSAGSAMPIAPILFWLGLFGGLVVWPIVFLLIRKFG